MLLCVGCSRAITNAPPESTPERNFEYLWQTYDRLYPSFELKGVDWDSVYAVYRPQITPQTTDQELFLIMRRMLATLQDGHVFLDTPTEHYSYTAYWDQYPINYDRDILRTSTISPFMGSILFRTISIRSPQLAPPKLSM